MKILLKFLLYLIFLLLTACAGLDLFYADSEIKKPITSENTALIVGLDLSGNLTSAKLQLNMNGKNAKGVGSIMKGKMPERLKNKNNSPAEAFVYTGDNSRGYIVFNLPEKINDEKIKEFLLYIHYINFSGYRPVQSPVIPGSLYGTDKITGEKSWWEPYDYLIQGNINLRNIDPIGNIKDPDWKFYGCRFTIEKPGIYYLGELKLYANLNIGDKNSEGDITNLIRMKGQNLENTTANVLITGYSNIEAFINFLKTNGIYEKNFFDYSEYCRVISGDEYQRFGQ